MRRSRFSEELIIHVLKEHEAGTNTADSEQICRLRARESPRHSRASQTPHWS